MEEVIEGTYASVESVHLVCARVEVVGGEKEEEGRDASDRVK